MSFYLVAFLVFSVALLYFRTTSTRLRYKGLPYPPGPKPEFLIGNARHLPLDQAWLVYTEWKEKYGDIIHLSALGDHIVVVNSYQTAHELMGQRSIYSDRPTLTMVGELIGWNRLVSLHQCDDAWRKARKLIHSAMSKGASQQYWPVQQREARVLLQQLSDDPGNYLQHMQLMVAKVIMTTTYGIKVKSYQDRYLSMIKTTTDTINKVFLPGSVYVDVLPILKYVPAWFPGAQFKRNAAEWRLLSEEMVNKPFEHVVNAMATGTAPPSFTSDAILAGTHDEDEVKWISANMYIAGADTTTATLAIFFLAMVLHPEVLERAHAEIDSVVGTQRLPTFQDRDSLPYVDCILKEVLRWIPVVPLSVPHRLAQDDEYRGYHIPGGSLILPNVWAMTRDQSVYNEPEKFLPERYEGEGGGDLDPRLYVFGFGRRKCAGLHFGENTLWINIVSILAAFDIKPALDEHGREITPEIAFTPGLVSHITPFQCDIKPRTSAFAALVQAG
ncbi:hypothetical protein BOTBODRAFT_175790 [Botryobasidium botryosum FD-172 SS1]|uniref:Cytochrome P450 n=1 Tax=Botryobasidium botryosum (strain FD-172 SS1) TaxID=930990 RepID=A0A067MEP2_BOTB1|nr:hypothetical protein BOTBODRAFT_175790 [Botryobasidium botryosum FD-172 SS1]